MLPTLSVFMVLAQVVEDPTPVITYLLKGLESGVGFWPLLPAIVWCIVWAFRKFIAPMVPFFGTKVGGLVLAFAWALIGAVIDTAMAGAAITGQVLLGLFFKVVVGFIGSMGIQSGQKSVTEPAPVPAA